MAMAMPIDGADEAVDTQVMEAVFGQADLDADQEQYLASLTALSLEALRKEPKVLREDSERISAQMEELAFENYTCFVASSQCIGTVHAHLEKVDAGLVEAEGMLPRLASRCSEFVEVSKGLSQERAANKVALGMHTQLVELLEVPQWMQTCVRNGFYEESLQLQAFVARLEKKFPNDPIVHSIVEDVRSSTALMLSHLHQQLRGNVQLPACLRIIGFLRRLGLYSEMEMRVCFLQSRDAWLQSIIDAIPTSNAYTYLNKLTDTSRAHLFDIITQYRAIFTDSAARDTVLCEQNMLNGWLTHRIEKYISNVQEMLPRVTDGGSVANLLDQAMYLGMSLGRVGADFRSLLPPIFEDHIAEAFTKSIRTATSACIDALQQPIVQHQAAHGFNPSSASADRHVPDQALLDFPPLAVLCNAYLSAFNELRQCAPLGVKHRVASAMRESFTTLVSAVQARGRRKNEKLTEFATMCSSTLIPFLSRCFFSVFAIPDDPALIDVESIVAPLEPLQKGS